MFNKKKLVLPGDSVECRCSLCLPDSEGEEKDSMALLNEILGSLSVEEGDSSREQADMFRETEEGSSMLAEAQPKENSFFLPSQLLDQSLNNPHSSLSGQKKGSNWDQLRPCKHLNQPPSS